MNIDSQNNFTLLQSEINFIEKHHITINNITSTIHSIESYFQIKTISTENITALIYLLNKKIATGSYNGDINIFGIDFVNKTKINEIFYKKAHKYCINSICELNMNRIATASEDNFIKIWEITQNIISLITTLKSHTYDIRKIILSAHNQNLISCSHDFTIRIWNSHEPYNLIKIIKEEDFVSSMIQLKNQPNILIISCDIGYLGFWDLLSLKKIAIIQGVYTENSNGLIELPNDNVVVSQYARIVIIDPIKYEIIKEIENDYITYESTLCLLGNNGFIYVYNGVFIQIGYENGKYQIIFINNEEEESLGNDGVIYFEKEKYLICSNLKKGLTVLKLNFDE